MTQEHLSDEQIQQQAENSTSVPRAVSAHAAACTECREKVEEYRLLMKAVKVQPVPAFDFDLSQAVIAQIAPQKKKSYSKDLWVWFLIITVIISAAIFIYFKQYLTGFFSGIATLTILIAAGAGLLVLIVLLLDMYKAYERKMKMLELS